MTHQNRLTSEWRVFEAFRFTYLLEILPMAKQFEISMQIDSDDNYAFYRLPAINKGY